MYRATVRAQVVPAFGRLCLREVTPGAVNRAVTTMAQRSGSGAAKTTRACMSGDDRDGHRGRCGDFQPSAGLRRPVDTSAKKAPRVLSVEDTELLRGGARAAEIDVADLVDSMLATGARIGEALALRTGETGGRPLLDLDAGTWEVNATAVRVPKQGMAVQPQMKTAAGWRNVALPGFAMAMVRRRLESSAWPNTALVFPAPVSGTLRDPTNVSTDLRQLLDGFKIETCLGAGARPVAGGRPARCTEGPWSWGTPPTFRKTVATRLDEAGFSPRRVADQLGHANPSMTLDVYFGRQVISAKAARVLGR